MSDFNLATFMNIWTFENGKDQSYISEKQRRLKLIILSFNRHTFSFVRKLGSKKLFWLHVKLGVDFRLKTYFPYLDFDVI